MHEKRSLPELDEAITEQYLLYMQDDIGKLSDLRINFEQKLNSDKRTTRTWARVKTVLSEKKIATLRGHLERAKTSIQMLQMLHFRLVENEICFELDADPSITALATISVF